MRPRHYLLFASLILLVGFALRMWDLGAASLWVDEAISEARAQTSLSGIFDSVVQSGNQTPLYFVALHFFPHFTEALLRLPSVLLGLLGIALTMALAIRLYHDHRLALWAGALVACNPYHIWLSRTARPYSPVFVLSLLVSYYFLALVHGRRTRATWIGFGLSSMVAYLTHYFTAALPLAQAIILLPLLRRDWPFVRRWFWTQALAVIPLVLWSVLVMFQMDNVNINGEWIPRPGLLDIPLTFWSMTMGYDGPRPWVLVPGIALAVAGVVGGLILAYRARASAVRTQIYWFWLVVAPLVIVFAVSLVFQPLYVDRYFMVFLPALVFLIPAGLRWLPQPLLQGALALILLTGFASLVLTLANGSYQREDWRAVAAYIAQEGQPGDGFMVENEGVLRAFRRYFDAELPVSVMRQVTVEDDPLSWQANQVGRVWAIYRNPNEDIHRQGVMPSFDPFAHSRYRMGQWLIENRLQVISREEFNGVTVLLLNIGYR